MIDVSTSLGRFLARLKFCAVAIRDLDGRSFIATRCSSTCGRFRSDDEGVDGSVVEVAEVDSGGNVSKFTRVDFSRVVESGIVTLDDGNFYLDRVSVD